MDAPATSPPRPPRRIRLVHCIGTMRVGGAEKQLAELIRRLPRDRFEQSLVLLQGGGPLIESVREAGCEVIELGYRMKYRVYDPRCYLAMARALGRFWLHLRGWDRRGEAGASRRADILHAQLYWANVLSVVAGRLARVPVVLTSRLQLSDYKFGRPMLQRIEDAANLATTAVFANSEAVRRDALAHERIDERKLRLIYNGVALENFRPIDASATRREFGIEPEDVAVVAVANLHPYKGHEDLLRALASLRVRGGAFSRLRAVLPGRDQGARGRLEALVAELGLEDAVRLPGEREDVPAILQMADIVVHPSHQEGFSNAILEAMTAGRPVVATAVGGNPEAVVEGETGFLVPARDPEALAAAIGRLAEDRELRGRMGAAGRARIELEFSMDRMIERFVAWYEELAEGASR